MGYVTNDAMDILTWMFIALTTMVIGIWALFAAIHLLRRRRERLRQERITDEGSDFMATVTDRKCDPNMKRAEGSMPCRLVLSWTHPETSAQFEFRSPWFWAAPTREEDGQNFPTALPVRVVLSDPAVLHRVDMKELNADLL